MDDSTILYSINVEDFKNVIEENELDIRINDNDWSFIQDRLGDYIDWDNAVSLVLDDLETYRNK